MTGTVAARTWGPSAFGALLLAVGVASGTFGVAEMLVAAWLETVAIGGAVLVALHRAHRRGHRIRLPERIDAQVVGGRGVGPDRRAEPRTVALRLGALLVVLATTQFQLIGSTLALLPASPATGTVVPSGGAIALLVVTAGIRAWRPWTADRAIGAAARHLLDVTAGLALTGLLVLVSVGFQLELLRAWPGWQQQLTAALVLGVLLGSDLHGRAVLRSTAPSSEDPP